METTEGSTTPESSAPAPEPASSMEERYTKQPMPDRAPPEGCRFVYNERSKMFDVERIPDGEPQRAGAAPDAKEQGEEAPVNEYTPELPGHVPQSVQYNENVQGALHELGGILRESAIAPEVGQSYVDVYTEYAMEHPATAVDPMNPGAVHAQLKALWGETYGTRWGHVLKAWNGLSPKSQDWVANHAEHPVAMFRTLAAIGSGTFGVSREQAQEAVAKMRADKKSPLYDLSHKEHRLYKDTFRNLSLVANREDKPKGRQGNVEELVRDRQDAEAKAKGKPLDDATAKLDAEITAIRVDKGYSNPSAVNHKALVARMQELMRQRWPD